MNNKQINTTIAEACGWDSDDIARGYTLCQFSENVPDYCNDLNAMHEAEKIFDNALYCRYIDELCTQAIKGKNCMYLATAAQRAEAFLKTIGKWEGGPQ